MMRKLPKIGVTAVILKACEVSVSSYDVLMIRRGKMPDMGKWSLAGGHLEWGEKVRDCAMRETREEVSISPEHLKFSEAMSSVDTVYSKVADSIDFHFVNVSCIALVRPGHENLINPVAASDAMEVKWFTVNPKQWSDVNFLEQNEIIATVAGIIVKSIQLLQMDAELSYDEKFIRFPTDDKEKSDSMLKVDETAHPMSPATY
jgi:ADP-ribose pyrophosphatase YjhB (NUDIX family)